MHHADARAAGLCLREMGGLSSAGPSRSVVCVCMCVCWARDARNTAQARGSQHVCVCLRVMKQVISCPLRVLLSSLHNILTFSISQSILSPPTSVVVIFLHTSSFLISSTLSSSLHS